MFRFIRFIRQQPPESRLAAARREQKPTDDRRHEAYRNPISDPCRKEALGCKHGRVLAQHRVASLFELCSLRYVPSLVLAQLFMLRVHGRLSLQFP